MRTIARVAAAFPSGAARAALLLCSLSVAACDESPTSATASGSDGVSASGSPSSSSRATLRATSFLAFGDSITAGEVTAPASAGRFAPFAVVPGAAFPAQLQTQLQARYASQAAAITVANAGQSNEVLSVGTSLARLADLLANSRTEALLLEHGYNDLLAYGAGGVSPAIAVFDQLAREGRRRGARVFIGLLPPPIAGRQRSVPDGVVRQFNDQLRGIAAGEGAVVVDVYSALAADVGRYIGADGHHPTEAGYRRIADEFLARIAAELEAR